MMPVEHASAEDRRTYVRVERSGGRPSESNSFTFPNVLAVLGRWLVWRLVFRGGWTVHLDAPDSDPRKIRCADQARADALAEELKSAL
jgi:hypothetical protein